MNSRTIFEATPSQNRDCFEVEMSVRMSFSPKVRRPSVGGWSWLFLHHSSTLMTAGLPPIDPLAQFRYLCFCFVLSPSLYLNTCWDPRLFWSAILVSLPPPYKKTLLSQLIYSFLEAISWFRKHWYCVLDCHFMPNVVSLWFWDR